MPCHRILPHYLKWPEPQLERRLPSVESSAAQASRNCPCQKLSKIMYNCQIWETHHC